MSQQFHFGVILLHRAFAFSDLAPGSDQEAQLVKEEMDRLFDIPRRVSLNSAIQIAEILFHHQKEYHTRTIFATSVQHADAAMIVLTKSLEQDHTLEDVEKFRRAYSILTTFIRTNAAKYDPAARLMAKFRLTPEDFDSRRLT